MRAFEDMTKGCFMALNAMTDNWFVGKEDWLMPSVAWDSMVAMRKQLEEQLHQPLIISHGDLHGYNLVFRASDAGVLRAVIDWQAAHPGFFVEDFGRLFAFSVVPSVRRANLGRLLARYHARITAALPDHPLFTLDELREAMRVFWPNQVAGFASVVPGFMQAPSFKALPEETQKAQMDSIINRLKASVEDCQPSHLLDLC